MPQSSSLAATIFAWARPRRSHDRAQSSTARHHGQRQHYTAAGIEPTERNRPQPDTTDKANTTPQQAFEPTEPNRPQSDTVDNANTTPQQAFGPIEATNALVGNAFFGNTNINFNGALSEVPGARAEKDACLKSLALGEIHTRRHDIAVAHPDTCDWLFRTPEFRQWRDPNSRHHHFGVLWIKGKPGAGKSTLMKHAFSCFQEDMFDGHLVVAHFFNARGATIEKTSLGLLRSIVYQLLQDEEIYGLFEDHLRHKKLSASTMGWQWHLSELQDFVHSIIRRPRSRPLLLLIDALDECDESQARDVVVFLESLSIYAFQARLPLQICLSSRHYPSIRINKVIELVVETSQDHRADIAKYISDRLRIHDAIIEAEITKRASGVFLWVVIIVSILNKANDEGRVEMMQKTLDEVPNDMDKVFTNILNSVSDATETLLILQWVLLSRRPLTLSELFAAVFQGLASQPIDLMKRRIITSSKGLVEMRSGGSDTMQFIHLSVEDFLYRRKRLSVIDPSLEPEPITISHGRLWARCWACIEQACTTNISVNEEHMAEAFQKNPFLSYATSNILHHADLALTNEKVKAGRDEDLSGSLNNPLQLSIKKWLRRSDRWFPSWKRFLRLLGNDDMASIGTEPQSNLVYAAVVYGLSNLFTALQACDIDAQGKLHGSALQLASITGNYHIALLLFESGVDVNAQGGQYSNALQAACSSSINEQMVKLLLEAGADVNAQGGVYGNALQAACSEKPDKRSAALLLKAQAQAHANAHRNDHTLQAVYSDKPNEQIVRLLLEAGADVNTQGSVYGNALQAACYSGQNEQIVRLLLEAGADVNAQGGKYRNALQAACFSGQSEQIVRLLLEAGADVSTRGGIYDNALQAACSSGRNEQIVRLLLEVGAEVNAQGGKYRNALQAACFSGQNEQIVRLLLEAGADVNTQGGIYGNALQAACTDPSDERVIIRLLEAGADVNARSGNRDSTALEAASSGGYQDVVQLLLDAGATANISGA